VDCCCTYLYAVFLFYWICWSYLLVTIDWCILALLITYMNYCIFNYGLKVWLTSVVVSPILYILIEVIINPGYFESVPSRMAFIVFSIPYGLILSIPSCLLLLASIYVFNRMSLPISTSKIWLSITGIILTLIPFVIMYHSYDIERRPAVIPWAISYCLVIVAGIWFYKLKLVKQ
jgi:hypothetical protein